MDTTIATAAVKFRLDVNFGDPITPAPGWVALPSLRPGIGQYACPAIQSRRYLPENRHGHRARTSQHPRPRLCRHLRAYRQPNNRSPHGPPGSARNRRTQRHTDSAAIRCDRQLRRPPPPDLRGIPHEHGRSRSTASRRPPDGGERCDSVRRSARYICRRDNVATHGTPMDPVAELILSRYQGGACARPLPWEARPARAAPTARTPLINRLTRRHTRRLRGVPSSSAIHRPASGRMPRATRTCRAADRTPEHPRWSSTDRTG
jgi:hypothetical protein